MTQLIFIVLLGFSAPAFASDNKPLHTKWDEVRGTTKYKQNAICSDMRGAAFINKIEKDWYLYTGVAMAGIKEAEEKVKLRCGEWSDRKQDSTAVSNLSEAREKLGIKLHGATEMLNSILSRIEEAKPLLKSLWADGCIYRLNTLKSDIPVHLSGLANPRLSECPEALVQ